MNTSKKKIDVFEYDSIILKGAKKPNKLINAGSFKFNKFRLAIAIAKCTFTKNVDWQYCYTEALINILRVQTLIQKTKDKKLLLNKNRIDSIRDFSKTTRIGELGQGISFLFAQDCLSIPTPFDFGGYCELSLKVIVKGSTPDFIGSSSMRTYDLLEAKGSLETQINIVKSRLIKALKQCDEGEKILNSYGIPNAKRKFGFLSLFELHSKVNKNNSSIHFCDPEDSPDLTFNSWQLIVNYYKAIFFGFIGLPLLDLNKSDLLKANLEIEEVRYKNHNFLFFNSTNPWHDREELNYQSLFKGSAKFGISSKILDLLVNEKNDEENYFKAIQEIRELNYSEITSIDFSINYELFSDGTIFEFKL